jgi:TM2 domain-containing membrane protein YozV
MALLSFFVPGLGQLLMGQTFKGVALFIASYLTFWFFCAPFFVAAYDAYAIARRKNAGETVGEWQFF